MFAETLPADYRPNAITRLVAARRGAGQPVIDLTASNPAALGLSPDPVRLAPALAAGAQGYQPDPRGAPAAREAVAGYYRERSLTAGAARIVLTASTSEAYSWLLKLFRSRRQGVLVPVPGYPLCADLARLEQVETTPYRLRPGPAGWRLDRSQVAAGLRRGARLVIAISPHNPTGAYLAVDELGWLGEVCAAHHAALVVDEVFADYPWDGAADSAAGYGELPALTFVLGGLSKALALPQLKCGWIVVFGGRQLADLALAHLDYLGDTYLSVNSLVQAALPELLAQRRPVQRPILARVRANVAALRSAPLPPQEAGCAPSGGWWWLQSLPAGIDDADFAAALLRDRSTLVHPGYLFDAAEPSVALSLITAPEVLAAGLEHLVAALDE